MNEAGKLWIVLWRAMNSVQRNILQHIQSTGLGASDFAVLEVLFHKGPLPVNVIGAKVLLTSGSITTAIDRLEIRKLVKRQNDPNDRRGRIVHLTAYGRSFMEEVMPEHLKVIEEATSGLSKEEKEEAIRLLKKLGIAAETIYTQQT